MYKKGLLKILFVVALSFMCFPERSANSSQNRVMFADDMSSLATYDRILFRMDTRNRMNSRNRLLPIDNTAYKCRIMSAILTNAQVLLENRPERNLLMQQMRVIFNSCGGSDYRSLDSLNKTFIFPGTNWCGQGNTVQNYHDLGVFNETDACCREHDFCDDIIQPGRSKHNLINPYGTTRLHCKCDEALRNCFRNVRSVVANTVGYIFFSLLQTQCFDFDHPTIGCEVWRRGAVRLYCVKYRKNTNAPKKWQWFDQEPYF